MRACEVNQDMVNHILKDRDGWKRKIRVTCVGRSEYILFKHFIFYFYYKFFFFWLRYYHKSVFFFFKHLTVCYTTNALFYHLECPKISFQCKTARWFDCFGSFFCFVFILDKIKTYKYTLIMTDTAANYKWHEPIPTTIYDVIYFIVVRLFLSYFCMLVHLFLFLKYALFCF